MGRIVAGCALIELLGRGGDGEVWLARSPAPLHRLVAVKRLQPAPGDRAALLARAGALAALVHPHICPLLDLARDGDGWALVTPLAEGGSLARALEVGGPLPAARVVGLAARLAAALDAAHRHGLHHGDVKPANVVLTAGGEPLLIDFALGGGALATPGYAPPQPSGGPSDDVYGLAATCVAALTGAPPAPGWSPGEGRAVSGALARLLEEALAAEASARPSAGAFAAALRACPEAAAPGALLDPPLAGRVASAPRGIGRPQPAEASGAGPAHSAAPANEARPTRAAARPRRRLDRRRGALAVAAVLVLVLGAAGGCAAHRIAAHRIAAAHRVAAPDQGCVGSSC